MMSLGFVKGLAASDFFRPQDTSPHGLGVVAAEGQKTSRLVLALSASAYWPPLAFSMS